MTDSILTRLRISKAFKKLVQKESFEKITVSSIMKEAGMRRQTFYDFYYDKYDLVDWIFNYEAVRYIGDNLSYSHWEDIIKMLIEYFREQRYFYQQIFEYSSQNSFKKTYQEQVLALINNIQINQTPEGLKSSKDLTEEQVFVASLLSHGIVEMTILWINENCHTSSDQFSQQIINTLTKHLKE